MCARIYERDSKLRVSLEVELPEIQLNLVGDSLEIHCLFDLTYCENQALIALGKKMCTGSVIVVAPSGVILEDPNYWEISNLEIDATLLLVLILSIKRFQNAAN